MNTPKQTEDLIAAYTTAHRDHDPRSLRGHPAFYDLDEQGRLAAFDALERLRTMEAALDPDGLSTTAKAVLNRIPRPGPAPG